MARTSDARAYFCNCCPNRLSVQNSRTAELHQSGVTSFRRLAHLRRCASAMRLRPSAVFGPVLIPPWFRHRNFPGTTFRRHGDPLRVFAPQTGRNRFGDGLRDPKSPRASSRLWRHARLRASRSAFRAALRAS